MQKITPCLWFNDKAEQAAKFYMSIFKNSKIKGLLAMVRREKSFRKTKGNGNDR